MRRPIKAGATDQTIDVFIQDSSSTTGAGLTGLVFNSASLVCYYRKGATGSATALALATQTVGGAHSDGGFVEISSGNMPGMYRLDLSDTIVDTAGPVSVMLKGATNMAPCPIELQVVSYNAYDSVRLGLTALPNAAADAAGGLPISDAGGLDLDSKLANTNEVTAARMGALTDWIDGGRLDLILDARASQSSLDTVDDFLDTEIAAIKAKTDNLPSDPADASDIASSFTTVNTKLDTIDDFLDTEIAAIKAKTDSLTFSTANRVDAQLFGAEANTLTASALATDAVTEIQSGLATAASISALNNLSAAQVTAAVPTANANADALLDRADGVETGLTPRNALRLIAASGAGKLSGAATTTVVLRNAVADSKNRITATVDADGNRTAITTDLT